MKYSEIKMLKENFYQILSKLGSIDSSIEFEDLNKNEIESSKPHYPLINRCDEIETIFTHLDEIITNDMKINYELYNNYEDFQTHLNFELKRRGNIKEINLIDEIQNLLTEDENKIKTQFTLNKQQIDLFHKLLEKKYIYEKMVELFEANIISEDKNEGKLNYNYIELNDEEENLNLIQNKSHNLNNNISLYHLSGMCDIEDVMKLRRIVFRASKGLGFPCFYYPTINEKNIIFDEKKYFGNKQIFSITLASQYAMKKIRNTIEILNYDTFYISNALKLKKELENINEEVLSQKEIILNSQKVLLEMIKPKTDPVKIDGKYYKSLYSLYRTFSKREKYIYINLNKCKDLGDYYVGDIWVPMIEYNNLINKLSELKQEKEDINLPVPKIPDSPGLKIRTYFHMDDFVYPFQSIVNTYGIPRYQEANPGLFTIITFPFLFGIMFGDIGHGFLLLLLSLYIEINCNAIKESKSILKDLVKYRYILLLMGFFSFFCGIIYNDFMAIPLSVFKSCYINDKNQEKAIKKDGCTYPIGMDPKWYSSSNELTFMNSFKMKWSVIIGVIQMTLGIFLRGLNNLYFGDYLGFFLEFIPQIIFMTLLFGYMIALIFIKWNTDYTGNTENAPSIITILMNLALKNGSVDGKPVWTTVENEERANKIFFYISLICIPVILLPKPIIKILRNEKYKNLCKININLEEDENTELPFLNKDSLKKEDEIQPLLNEDDLQNSEIKFNKEKKNFYQKYKNMKLEKEESPSDIFVHQIIETIEFVLGCISNTASYLRLWALSLAHSQLSKVFFEKSLLGFAKNSNFLFVVFGYFIFANITISVLMGMDLLEAFLHTLRLHWVEFQNKFYYADGTEFSPFSFKLLLSNEK